MNIHMSLTGTYSTKIEFSHIVLIATYSTKIRSPMTNDIDIGLLKYADCLEIFLLTMSVAHPAYGMTYPGPNGGCQIW